MTRVLTALGLIVVLCLAPPAHAGFYQFTLGGEVTQSTHANVSVGDPFTIRYVADSFDRDPSPTFGSYAATPLTIQYPATTTISIGNSPGVFITLFPDGRSTVDYSDIGGIDTFSRILFNFPPGVLASDGLPLTLPVKNDTFGTFSDAKGPGPGSYQIIGRVMSYASVEVPEPCLQGLLLVPLLVLSFRHRLQ